MENLLILITSVVLLTNVTLLFVFLKGLKIIKREINNQKALWTRTLKPKPVDSNINKQVLIDLIKSKLDNEGRIALPLLVSSVPRMEVCSNKSIIHPEIKENLLLFNSVLTVPSFLLYPYRSDNSGVFEIKISQALHSVDTEWFIKHSGDYLEKFYYIEGNLITRSRSILEERRKKTDLKISNFNFDIKSSLSEDLNLVLEILTDLYVLKSMINTLDKSKVSYKPNLTEELNSLLSKSDTFPNPKAMSLCLDSSEKDYILNNYDEILGIIKKECETIAKKIY